MLADLIFDRARLTPGQTAVIYNGARISYRAFADFICLARGYFAKLTNVPYKRFVELGEGTHTVMMEKNRMQLFQEVQLFLDEPG